MMRINETQDVAITIVGLIAVLGLSLTTLLFPLYDMRDGTWVRQPIWNPPRVELPNRTQSISSADKQRLMADPQQRQILESLEKLSDGFFQPKPDWLGWRTPQHRAFPMQHQRLPANGLLAATIVAIGVYTWYLWKRFH